MLLSMNYLGCIREQFTRFQNISEFSHLGQPNHLLQPQVRFTAHKAPLLSFGSEWYKRQRRVKSFVYPPFRNWIVTSYVVDMYSMYTHMPSAQLFCLPISKLPHPVNKDWLSEIFDKEDKAFFSQTKNWENRSNW